MGAVGWCTMGGVSSVGMTVSWTLGGQLGGLGCCDVLCGVRGVCVDGGCVAVDCVAGAWLVAAVLPVGWSFASGVLVERAQCVAVWHD